MFKNSHRKMENCFVILKIFLPAAGWRPRFARQIIAKWLLNDNSNPETIYPTIIDNKTKKLG